MMQGTQSQRSVTTWKVGGGAGGGGGGQCREGGGSGDMG